MKEPKNTKSITEVQEDILEKYLDKFRKLLSLGDYETINQYHEDTGISFFCEDGMIKTVII